MKSDGSIIIDTKILDDGMEKGFEVLKNEMASVGLAAEDVGDKIKLSFSKAGTTTAIRDAVDQVARLQQEFSKLDEDYNREKSFADSLAAEFEEADRILKNAALEYTPPDVFMAAKENKEALSKTISQQKKIVDSLGKKWASVNSALEKSQKKLTTVIQKEVMKQAREEEKASARAIKAEQRETAAKKKEMDKQFRAATKSARHFGTRFRTILSGALVFNMISSGLRTMVSYFGEALKTSDSYRYAVGRLKGALLTVFQYIYEYGLPIILQFIKYITTAAQAVARFFATLSGKSTAEIGDRAEAMYNEAKGIEEVGKQAKKAKKELMGFDQLNRLSEKEEEEEKKETDSIKPIFDSIGESEWNKAEIEEWLKKILGIVSAIGAAILAWKIGDFFFDDLKKTAGLAAGLLGAFTFLYYWVDALVNGITWDNFGGMLRGLGIAVAGFTMAFGPLGAAISLLVGGIAMVIISMLEWIKTGELSNEACATLVAGILAIGAAFTIFTADWIPLLISAVVALLAVVAKNAEKIKDVLNKLGEWLKNVFCKDWKKVFGVTLGTAMNVLVEIAGGVFRGMKDILFGFLDILTGIFTLNWKKIWGGLGSVVKGAVNGIIGVLNGMIAAVTGAINLLMKILWGGANAVQKLLGRQTYSIPQINPPKIPYLAQGAVIPPNAPFLAMLGDQKNGNNIEAPEDLIRKIVREESGANSETIAVLRAILSAVQSSGNSRIVINGRDVFQTVVDENNRATRIYGVSPLKV